MLVTHVEYGKRAPSEQEPQWITSIHTGEALCEFRSPDDQEDAIAVFNNALGMLACITDTQFPKVGHVSSQRVLVLDPIDLVHLDELIRTRCICIDLWPYRSIRVSLDGIGINHRLRLEGWLVDESMGDDPPSFRSIKARAEDKAVKDMEYGVIKSRAGKEEGMEGKNKEEGMEGKIKTAAASSKGAFTEAMMEGLAEAAVEQGSEGFIDIVKEGFADNPMLLGFLETNEGKQAALLFVGLLLHFTSSLDIVPGLSSGPAKEVQKIMMKNSMRQLASPQFARFRKMMFASAKAAMAIHMPGSNGKTPMQSLLDMEVEEAHFDNVESVDDRAPAWIPQTEGE